MGSEMCIRDSGNRIGQSLFSQVRAENYETVELDGNGPEVSDTQEDLGLSEIEISISLQDYEIVCALMLAICIISILLASYPVLKMKPKNILSQMS